MINSILKREYRDTDASLLSLVSRHVDYYIMARLNHEVKEVPSYLEMWHDTVFDMRNQLEEDDLTSAT